MNDVINHETNNCIWYHTTNKDRLESILTNGLKINSPPVWQGSPEPWIYLSTTPWNTINHIVLEIDLSFLDKEDCGWAFADNDSPIEQRWQLRVFNNIDQKYIKIKGDVVI